MDLKTFVMYVFMFIGIIVCVVVTAVALVWVTCFVVRLLIKTFGTKLTSYTDIVVEDIKEKSKVKRELKEQARQAQKDHKEELLKVKLESKKRINDLKKKKLEEKLREKEIQKSLKLFGSYEAPESVFDENKEETEVENTSLAEKEYGYDKNENSLPEIDEGNLVEEDESSNSKYTSNDDENADYFDYTSEFEKPAEQAERKLEKDDDVLEQESDNEIEESQNDEKEENYHDEREKEIAEKLKQIKEENVDDVQELIILDDGSDLEDFDEKFKSMTDIQLDESEEETHSENKTQNDDDFDFNKYMQEEFEKETQQSDDEEEKNKTSKKKSKK